MAKNKKITLFPIIALSFIVVLIFRPILANLIGSKGVAYFGVSNEMFFLVVVSVTIAIEKSVSTMIENRIARQQYDNASRVIKAGFIVTAFISVLITIVLYAMSETICLKWFEEPLSLMGFKYMLISVVFFAMGGLIRGFFTGYGNRGIAIQSYIIFSVSFVIFGSVLSKVMSNYGAKVSTLLRLNDYEYSYGAAGASIGLVIASFLVFAHALVCFILFSKRTVFGQSREYNKSYESIMSAAVSVLLNGLVSFGITLSIFAMSFMNCIVILSQDIDKNVLAYTFGEYYGKAFPLCFIVIVLIGIASYELIRRSVRFIRRGENRSSRECLNLLIHRGITLACLAMALLIVLSSDMIDTFFSNNGTDTALYLQIEAIIIAFAAMAVICGRILLQLKYERVLLIGCGIGMVIHIIVIIISKSSGIWGAIIADIISALLICVISFFVVCRCFQYTQEWFRSFVVSFLGALITGIVVMLLNKLMLTFANSLISLIVSSVLGAFVYMIIILLLKGYSIEELENSAVGRFMIIIGRTFKLL